MKNNEGFLIDENGKVILDESGKKIKINYREN
jgi:hypothetical protein